MVTIQHSMSPHRYTVCNYSLINQSEYGIHSYHVLCSLCLIHISAASVFTHCVTFVADCSSGVAQYVNPEVCVRDGLVLIVL